MSSRREPILSNSISPRAGFTLVELMVAVGIAGILLTIGLPKMQAYQARAHTAEAKNSLAAMYVAEQSIYLDQKSYSACLYEIGFRPLGGKQLYAVGFGQVSTGCGPKGGAGCGFWNWDQSTGSADPARPCVQPVAWPAGIRMAQYGPASVAQLTHGSQSTQTFTAEAAGYVTTRGSFLDVWTIDQDKNLVEVSPNL